MVYEIELEPIGWEYHGKNNPTLRDQFREARLGSGAECFEGITTGHSSVRVKETTQRALCC
jgi:hypothetical protein